MARFSIGAAWDETRAFLQREAGLLLPVALALIGVPLALASMLLPTDTATEPRPIAEMFGEIAPALPLMLIGFLGNFAIVALALVPGISVAEAIRLALSRIWVALAAAAMIGAAAMAAIVALAVLLLILGIAAGSGPAGVATFGAGLVAGLFMLVGIRLVLLNVVIVAERLGPVAAVRRAWALTRGQFLRLLGLTMLFVITLAVIGVAVQVAGGSVAILLARATGSPLIATMIPALLDGALNALGSTLIGVMSVALYRQLAGGSISGT